MTLGTLLIVILIIALLGGFRDWGCGPFYGTGYYGGDGLGLLLVVVLLLVLTNHVLRWWFLVVEAGTWGTVAS